MDPQKYAIVPTASLLPLQNDKRDRTTPEYRQFEMDLAMDLKARGQRNAIQTMQEGQADRVLAGETRRRALIQAGIDKAYVNRLTRELTPGEILREQLLENEMRQDFTDRARFELYAEIMAANGLDPGGLAEYLGRPHSSILKILAPFSKLPEDLVKLIGRGENRLGPRASYQLSRLHPNVDAMRLLADRHLKGLLKVEALEREVARLLGKRPKKSKPIKCPFGPFVLLAPADSPWGAVEDLAKALAGAARRGAAGEFPLSVLPSLLKPN